MSPFRCLLMDLIFVLDFLQSKVFSKTATQVKQKKQWENMKLKVILAIIVGLVVLAIIIVLIVSLTPS